MTDGISPEIDAGVLSSVQEVFIKFTQHETFKNSTSGWMLVEILWVGYAQKVT